MLAILITLLVLLAFAYLVESLVEFAFETIAHWIVAFAPGTAPILFPPKDKPSHARIGIIQLSAIGMGICGAMIFRFDLLHYLSEFLSEASGGAGNIIRETTFTIVLTGIAIGKGSNYLHEFIKKYFRKSATTEVTS